MIDPNALLQVYVSEKATTNLVVSAHRHPKSLLKGTAMREFGNSFSGSGKR